MKRRSILQLAVSTVAAWPLRGMPLRAQLPILSAARISTLHAVGTVVLPSALAADGQALVVDGFVRWLGSYRAGADMGHGYGVPMKRTTPSIAMSRYADQIDGLERAASLQGGPLASLPLPVRQVVIERAIEDAGVKDLPPMPDGTHVVTDLMSYFFTSSEANDLCYQAEIRRDKCRGLPGSSARPVPWDARVSGAAGMRSGLVAELVRNGGGLLFQDDAS